MSSEVETVAIPVIEEELSLHRETVETGRVRVRTVPSERSVAIDEPLHRSDVVVERTPIDREISGTPDVREEGDTLIVPVVEERLVKRLFLVEEVRLTRRASTQHFEQTVNLRSQQVVVEREDESGHLVNKE